jgi:hypothetical protein
VRLAAAEAQIAEFVAEGGLLEFHAAGWGWNSGEASVVTLPGGMGIALGFSGMNDVLEPGHPLMEGVPDPFFGDHASHSHFTNVPPNALHIVQDDLGRTNLVEYAHGNGRVVTGGQAFEFAYTFGEDAGIILANMIPYALSSPPWLRVDPPQGVLPAGQTADVEVTFDAAGLEDGLYSAEISVASNDPLTPIASVSADLRVPRIVEVAVGLTPGTINASGSGDWIRARVELPAEYDARNVVLSTVQCMKSVPAVQDSAPTSSALRIKFDRLAVQSLLAEADQAELLIMGEIDERTWFEGTPSVRVIRPALVAPNGGETLASGSSFEVTWTAPADFPVDHAELYYTLDDAESWGWTSIASGAIGTSHVWKVPDEASQAARVRVYLYDAGGVYAVDTSDGVFEVRGQGTGSPVLAELPTAYALRQNVPNPFQSGTEIHLDLPKATRLELRIYDVSGRLVNVLADGRSMEGGTHAIQWNGTDETGRRVASGVYFYQLHTEDFQATRRMVKLR